MGGENEEEQFFQNTTSAKPSAVPCEEEEEDEMVRKHQSNLIPDPSPSLVLFQSQSVVFYCKVTQL